MYVCMSEVSNHVCMYVCMYVSNHVCMFETINHHPRTGSNSLRKTFSIKRFIQFFEICEGGVLLEAPDIHTNIHTYLTWTQIAPTSNLKAEGREKRA